MAAEAAGGVLDRDLRALSEVGLATGTVRARVNELGATQAETLALRQRLADQEAVIGRLLAAGKAMLATAKAEVRAQIKAEQARQEAARRPSAPPSARSASRTAGAPPARRPPTARA